MRDWENIDFDPATNPTVAMEWKDADGKLYTGQTQIPPESTDTTGGCFPRGELRWRNLGRDRQNEQPFDLVVTVTDQPSSYSDHLLLEYQTPIHARTSQAVFTGGYACLGFGLLPSRCDSGALLDSINAACADGTEPIMRGAEFDMQFVHAGTNEPMPPFSRMYMSFFDVDGDEIDGGSLYELNSIIGVKERKVNPATSTLQEGALARV